MMLLANREQMSELDYFDSDIHSGFCIFSEIELETKINDELISPYLAYVKGLINQFSLPNLSNSGVERLLLAGTRETEDQHAVPLCLQWHNSLLSEAALESDGKIITASDIDQALEKKYYRELIFLSER